MPYQYTSKYYMIYWFIPLWVFCQIPAPSACVSTLEYSAYPMRVVRGFVIAGVWEFHVVPQICPEYTATS